LITPHHGRAVDSRALAGAAAIGAVVGLFIGGAYLAGGMARAAVVHAHMARLADAAAGGFSNQALEAAQGQDYGALAIARRHDPYLNIDLDPRERHVAALTARLAQQNTASANPLLLRASLGTEPAAPLAAAPPIAMRPFSLRGALDQSRDLECLTQAVYYEARGESRSGQAAVAQVVLNRVRHPAFPKSVCGVVFQGARYGGCQFSFACDGSVYRRVERAAWRRAETIAAKALDGSVMSEVGSATHFHVSGLNPGWRNKMMRVAAVGSHVFYRFGGRAGRASAFDDVPELSPPLPNETVEAKPAEPKTVYASLSLAPVATAVAQGAANVAAAVAAQGAELVTSLGKDAKAEAKAEPVKAEPLPVAKIAPAAPQAAVAKPTPVPAVPVAKAAPVPAPAAVKVEEAKPAA
jgi:spore germination cell wall hydrolase CwlJ-like protein